MPQPRDVGTCPICEKETTLEQLEKAGMCNDCDSVLGKEAPESQEPIVEDNELATAVEAYKKHQEYVKQYNQKPGVKEKRKAYMKARNDRNKAIIKKARDAGLI